MALPTREQITKRLDDTLDAMVAGHPVPDPPDAVREHLDALLSKRQYTVRDGILVLLAMQVEQGGVIDWHEQGLYNPARASSRDLEAIYARLHIAGSREALQTGVKGVTRYIDRKNPTWKAVLEWAAGPHVDPTESMTHSEYALYQVADAFLYLAGGIAATARNLPDMPPLDGTALTFASVFALLDYLLTQSSHGAYEQFIFAALYEAGVRQERDDRSRVVTKNLNASDASSRTAGDVQHIYGGDVREAYEVTRDDWHDKIAHAEQAAKHHGLDRIHILGRGAQAQTGDQIAADLAGKVTKDVSVLEVRDEIRSLVHRLTPEYRRRALQLLYEHLVERQPRDALVSLYVDELKSRGLTLP